MLFTQDFLEILDTLKNGEMVAIPTEGVWGLSCRVCDLNMVGRIVKLKRRDPTKGLIVLVNHFSYLDPWYDCPILASARQESGRPSTWIIPVNDSCPDSLTGGRKSLAIRQVLMPSLVKIIDQVGPLVSTSANRSGRSACIARWQVRLQFGQSVGYVAKGRTQGYRKASTIRDMETGTVIRD